MAYLAVLASVSLVAAYAIVARLVNRHVPYEYMDEPFHVKQTQQYCRGNYFEWDPKITTFPGLYFAATMLISAFQIAGRLPKLEDACTTDKLRYVNIAFSLGCFVMFYRIHLQLHSPAASAPRKNGAKPPIPPEDSRQAILCALVLATLPLHFFYGFLFYTDVGGVFFIMFCYFLALRGDTPRAAVFGVIATFFRQTNAVWVAFILGASVLKYCKELQEKQRPSHPQTSPTIKDELATVGWALQHHLKSLLIRSSALALAPLGLVVFVIYNGGVAVGDKAAHKAVPHLAQILYFSVFAAGSLAPVYLSPGQLRKAVGQLYTSIRTAPARTLAIGLTATGLAAAIVSRFTLVHPYLLADNRHYTFYLWRRVIEAHPLARFLLIPAYLYSWWSLRSRLAAGKSGLWFLGLVACSAAVLVPAWLLEFRYFVVPLIFLVLNMPRTSERIWWLCIAQNVVVNAVTLYVFLFLPYTWADGSEARFMW